MGDGRKCLKLRRSLFENVPPFIQFEDSSHLVTDQLESVGDQGEDDDCQVWSMWLPSINQTVVRTVEQAGFSVRRIACREYQSMQGGIWDFADGPQEEEDFNHLNKLCKINRMPGSHYLCRKDQLTINYKWLQSKAGEDQFNFLPESYTLPEDREDLKKVMKATEDLLWIVKPANSSCGRGIEIINRTIDLPSKYSKAPYCVQRYIKKPFLINGTKFDLRLYVLLTSIDPIRLYLYKDGLVRFASEQYDKEHTDIKNNFVHLTNYAINRNNRDEKIPQRDGAMGSTKWTLRALWRYFDKHGIDWGKIWKEIEGICVKTVLCGHYDMVMSSEDYNTNYYNCYKLLGYDVMLDEDLKPWLLEVNSFPSMFPDKIDLQVNGPMVAEMFNILGFHVSGNSEGNDNDNIRAVNEQLNSLYKRTNKDDEEDFLERKEFGDIYDLLDLQSDDLRILMRAEEEHSQAKMFSRIFPNKDHKHLLQWLDISMRKDNLLAVWEEGKHDGSVSIEWLQERAKERRHLKK